MATQTSKSKKRLSRKEMREDKLIGMAQKVEQFYEQNRKLVMAVVAGILIVIVAFFLVRGNQQKAFEEASLNLSIAKVMFEMKRFDAAESQFQALKTQYGGRVAGEAQFYLAKSAFLQGKFEEAEAGFKEYISKYHVDKYIDVAAIAGLAACQESQGRYEEAAETYLSIPRKHRRHYFSAQAMYRAGECYLAVNQDDKAFQTYQLLLKQYPDSPLKNKVTQLVSKIQ
ncbi:tetratricopeptide repeat protein [bacterium]|nr:tetratricopeptide repeat protein [bacterium]